MKRQYMVPHCYENEMMKEGVFLTLSIAKDSTIKVDEDDGGFSKETSFDDWIPDDDDECWSGSDFPY